MEKMNLGRVESVPVREVWRHEAQDFTKWLAREENLSMLGEACGLDLELIDTESAVGSFAVDIFAQESGTGRKVVIENQLEDTNHDHLGKIITYAAGKNADAVIWIVARARDEHRQAIEWLNSHTDDDCSFFLVEIEAWRIGDSPVAPRFNVVESPNEWARAEKAKSGLTPTKRLQLEYWQAFREAALADAAFSKTMRPQKGQPQHWTTVHIGSSRYHLAPQILVQQRKIGIELYIPDDKDFGKAVFERQEEFEEAMGSKAVRFDASKACGLRFYEKGCDLNDRARWPEYLAWQLNAAVKLRAVVLKIDSQ